MRDKQAGLVMRHTMFLLYAGFIIRVDISSSDDELDGILYISFCIGPCVFP